MSILIKGMEMPTEQYGKMVITLYPNGHVAEYVGDIGRVWEAVSVPPHGRLIDADALAEKDNVRKPPKGDIVEVVRCKDCKHNSLNRMSGNIFCDLGMGMFQLYDFCSKGERKDDE